MADAPSRTANARHRIMLEAFGRWLEHASARDQPSDVCRTRDPTKPVLHGSLGIAALGLTRKRQAHGVSHSDAQNAWV